VSKQTKPFWQILAIFIVSSAILKIHKDFDELTHDIRKGSDAHQENYRTGHSLDFTLWVEVAEAHSRKCREDEVDADNYFFLVRFLFQLVSIVERELVGVIRRVLCEDVPEGPKKVSRNNDEDNKAANFERVHYVNLVHNFVVVFLQRLDLRV